MLDYQKFLESKVRIADRLGFDVSDDEINPILKPHQRAAVKWALAGGCRALFESFGLGKTIQELEIVRIALVKLTAADDPSKFIKRRGIIVLPLGVRQEFVRDALNILGWTEPPVFVRTTAEVLKSSASIFLTNYESIREGKLDVSIFDVISLDEASILRSFGSKTFSEFLFGSVQRVKYRFVATATPSPNEYQELLAYAHFLGVMDIGQARTRFFRRNSEKSDDLTLHPHKTREFWLWVASWGLFLQKPSDICECLCHKDISSKDGDSENSLSQNGSRANYATERGSANAIAETQNSQLQTDSSVDETLVVDALDLDMDSKANPSITSGNPCSTDAAIPETKTGKITEDEESPSVSVGNHSQISSRTSVNRQKATNSTEKITTETTSPQIATGSPQRTTLQIEDPEKKKHDLDADGSCYECRCDEGYALPELEVRFHELPVDHSTAGADKHGQGLLMRDTKGGLEHASREKRDTLQQRVDKMLEIVNESPDDHFLLWHDLEDERRAIERSVPDAVSVYGSQNLDVREKAIIDFSDGLIKHLAAKPVIAGSGCNFQRHCHRAIFVGIGPKFNDFIQAIHRIQRFLQQHGVIIDIIYAESEKGTLDNLLAKWERYKEQLRVMKEIIRKYGLSHEAMNAEVTRCIGVERSETSGTDDLWQCINNDAVLELQQWPNKCVDMILTSIPFSTQYEYTPSYNDFGHTDDNEHFFTQMDYLTPELFRVLNPGRVAAIHVKDRVMPSEMTNNGCMEVYEFHADVIKHFKKHGFAYLGMKTIVTDVVRENNQTYRLGYTEQCKDGTKQGVGMPEYLLLFRKPPSERQNLYADKPVVKSKDEYSLSRWQIDAHGFERVSGNRLLESDEFTSLPWYQIFRIFRQYSKTTVYDFAKHVELCERLDAAGRLPRDFMLLPPQSVNPDVWTDITRMRTLNSSQTQRAKVKHICPLQFDIVDRAIIQHSMPGETILDPFGGIGTVASRAIALGRKGISIELNSGYHADAVGYCQAAESKISMPSLFEIIETEMDAPEEAFEEAAA